MASRDDSAAIRVGGGEDAEEAGRGRGKFGDSRASEATINDSGAVEDGPASPGASAAAAAAVAPRNVVGRRVQTLQELSAQQGRGPIRAGATAVSAAGPAGGIDLSLLTASVAPPDALEEPDVVWQSDRLLQEVAQVRAAARAGVS